MRNVRLEIRGTKAASAMDVSTGQRIGLPLSIRMKITAEGAAATGELLYLKLENSSDGTLLPDRGAYVPPRPSLDGGEPVPVEDKVLVQIDPLFAARIVIPPAELILKFNFGDGVCDLCGLCPSLFTPGASEAEILGRFLRGRCAWAIDDTFFRRLVGRDQEWLGPLFGCSGRR